MSQSSELSSQQDANLPAVKLPDPKPPDPKPPDPKEPQANPAGASPPPSYVKLAMRNMVRKGGKSLFHFGLTTAGLLGLLLGLAYLTR